MADLRELKVSSMCILVLPKKPASIMGIGVGIHFDWRERELSHMADLIRELKVSSICILVLPKKPASIMGIGVGKHFDWVVGFAEHSSHSARHWLKEIKAIYVKFSSS
ncbi:hypothetical protein B296_00033294 [Ensete ventricosum]|uniref:Uncharacterized protein n=1 Tax=Ensete ventricosum TaxID=4639 RepID=A0A426ZIT5_ENSVE|nr:hypothetical protein B296_00033294 [Ensete ventricosum]